MLRASVRRLFPLRSSRGSRHGSRGWDWFHNALAEREKVPLKPHTVNFSPLDSDHVRPQVFFEFESAEAGYLGKLVIELADDIVPKAAENFQRLANGDNKHGYTYKSTLVHQIEKGFIVQMGDVENPSKTDSDNVEEQSGKDLTGTGGHSAFDDRYFDDEPKVLNHHGRGVITMINSGVNSNNSQFGILLSEATHLDGRQVAIGRVVEDANDVLEKIEQTFTVHPGKPLNEIKVSNCGTM
eukprot:g1822.t1